MHKKQTDGKKIPAKAAVKRLAAGGLSVLVAAGLRQRGPERYRYWRRITMRSSRKKQCGFQMLLIRKTPENW